MPKQSEPQKATVGRLMHAFKHGELESGSGEKVKSRKQAVAIALSEARAGNRERPKTKAELYAEAKKQDIAGRSKMSKAELARAVKR